MARFTIPKSFLARKSIRKEWNASHFTKRNIGLDAVPKNMGGIPVALKTAKKWYSDSHENISTDQFKPDKALSLTEANISLCKNLFSSNANQTDQLKQTRKANLGSMIEKLRRLVPMILVESLPKSMISSNIMLRILPIEHPYLPVLKGHVSYYTTCKTIQLILTSIVLNPKVRLHILSVKVEDQGETAGSNNYEKLGVYPASTKVIFKWSTCSNSCFHLKQTNDGALDPRDEAESQIDIDKSSFTSQASLGSHSWSALDPVSMFGFISNNPLNVSLPQGLIGLKKDDSYLERKVSGIFVFELNESNDEILVHTIEDVEILEKKEYGLNGSVNNVGLAGG